MGYEARLRPRFFLVGERLPAAGFSKKSFRMCKGCLDYRDSQVSQSSITRVEVNMKILKAGLLTLAVAGLFALPVEESWALTKCNVTTINGRTVKRVCTTTRPVYRPQRYSSYRPFPPPPPQRPGYYSYRPEPRPDFGPWPPRPQPWYD